MPDITYSSGIGDGSDLQLASISRQSISSLEIEPIGILGSPGFVVNEEIPGVKETIDTWIPEINPGYAYNEGVELYYYADKATEIYGTSGVYNASGYLSVQSSGYYSFCLSSQPLPKGPVIATKLPADMNIDDITSGNDLGVGRLSQMASGVSFLYSENSTQETTQSGYLIPIISKQQPAALTGFIEYGSGSFPYNEIIVPGYSGAFGILQAICQDVSFSPSGVLTECIFVPQSNRIFIPGNPGNLMINYEASEGNLSLSSLDINPLRGTSDFECLSLGVPAGSGSLVVTSYATDNCLVGNGFNYSDIYYSAYYQDGAPAAGVQLDIAIDRSYKYYDGSGFHSFTPISNDEILSGGKVYTQLVTDQLPSGQYIYDQNYTFLSMVSSGSLYQVQSNGFFITSGGYVQPIACAEYVDSRVTIPVGYDICSSGILITNEHGTASGSFVCPENKRKKLHSNIICSIDEVDYAYNEIIIDPTVYLEMCLPGENLVPDIERVTEVYYDDGIDNPKGYYPGSGLLIQNEPIGGYSSVSLYNQNSWLQFQQNMIGAPSPMGSGIGFFSSGNSLYLVPSFDPTGSGIVAVYETISKEVYLLDDLTEVI